MTTHLFCKPITKLQQWKSWFSLSKQTCLEILQGIIKGLEHTYKRGILHNDLNAKNVEEWNPIIINFREARFIAVLKPNMFCQSPAKTLIKSDTLYHSDIVSRQTFFPFAELQ